MNSVGVANMVKVQDDPHKADKIEIEYTKIYPDLSNRYAVPHDANTGDYFTMPDNSNLISKMGCEPPDGIDTQNSVNDMNKMDNICSIDDLKNVDSTSQMDTNQAFSETCVSKPNPNFGENIGSKIQSSDERTRTDSYLAVTSEGSSNDADISSIPKEQTNASYSTDQFEESTDEVQIDTADLELNDAIGLTVNNEINGNEACNNAIETFTLNETSQNDDTILFPCLSNNRVKDIDADITETDKTDTKGSRADDHDINTPLNNMVSVRQIEVKSAELDSTTVGAAATQTSRE